MSSPFEQAIAHAEQFRRGKRRQPIDIDNFQEGFRTVSLDISSIACEAFTWKIRRSERLGGYLRFEGDYRVGSAGKHDAVFIGWRIDEFCDYVTPQALIVDFTSLNYTWGDDLYVYPYPRVNELRVVVDKSKLESFQGILARELIRTDLASTFGELEIEKGVRHR